MKRLVALVPPARQHLTNVAVTLAFSPLGPIIGFQPLGLPFYGALALIVAAYLVLVQGVKAAFYRSLAHLVTVAPSRR